MGTRSDIIVHRADGLWHRIYCHWDGYLKHNGMILFNHYTGQEKVEQLIALGNLSSLGPEIGRKHSFEARGKTMCTAYIRDRGMGDWHFAKTEEDFLISERGVIGDTLFAVWPEQGTWTEFTYIWCDATIGDKPRDPCWWVADPDKGTQDLVNLGDALQGKITVRPNVKAFGAVIGKHSAIDPKNPDHGWTSIR